MVRLYFFIIGFLCFISSSLTASVTVDATIDSGQAFVEDVIKGSITVTHPEKEKVDPSSFYMKKKPLDTVFKKNVSLSSGQNAITVSIYYFELPPQKEGLYVLPPISVKVAGRLYQSTSTSYEVKKYKGIGGGSSVKQNLDQGDETYAIQTKSEDLNLPTTFRLESIIEGPAQLYPGQRARFIYRINYNNSVDLSESHFPLLEAAGFKKIGDMEIKDYEKGGMSFQDIIQEVEAIKAGTFYFDASLIEGYAYKKKSHEKIYDTQLLKAESPPVTVVVEDFPLANKPVSFTGGMGTSLEGEIKMVTPPNVQIGDSIHLELKITGPTNLSEMHLPHLDCQPGIAGFFELNNLPPLSTIKELVKEVHIELRPISLFVKAVPSIELSIFNPNTQNYIAWRSKPISLTVLPGASSILTSYDLVNVNLLPFIEPPKIAIAELIKTSNLKVDPIKAFDPILVQPNDLHFNIIQTPWVVCIIPLSLLFLFWQYKEHEQVIRRRMLKKETSEEVLERVFRQADAEGSTDWSQCVGLLKTALFSRLAEAGYVKNEEDSIKSIENKPYADEIKIFINELEDAQYGINNIVKNQFLDLRQRTRNIMDKIYSIKVGS